MSAQPEFRAIGDLPQNLEAEGAVLGSLLIDTRAIERVMVFLKPEDFFMPGNGAIYAAMCELFHRNQASDFVTVTQYLQERKKLDASGGAGYLASLASIVPTSINVEHYAHIVAKLGLMRRLVDAGQQIANFGYDTSLDPKDALGEAEKVLFSLGTGHDEKDFVSLATALTAVYDEVAAMHSGEKRTVGAPIGFPSVDKLTGGLRPGQLAILAARPSMGKSAWAFNIAHNVTKSSGTVGIFSLEMSEPEVVERLLSLDGAIDSTKIRTGRMSSPEWDGLVETFGRLAEHRILIDDTPAMSLMEMRVKARRLHHAEPLSLIVVDYLQLMVGPKSEGREKEVSAISRGLKALAREIQVPILALAQLNRQPDDRPDHQPILSDLRESGSIEADADIVLFMMRPAQYDSNAEDQTGVSVTLAKHRNGPKGRFTLEFREEYGRFAEREYRYGGEG